MQAGGSNWQTVSTDIGKSWSDPTGINLGVHNGTSVGPGRGLQLSEDSPAPGRILFIGHHGPYEVSNIPTLQEKSALLSPYPQETCRAYSKHGKLGSV